MSPPLHTHDCTSHPQVYLFDLDGTLINTALDIAAAVNATRARYLLPALPPEEVEGAVGYGATELLRATLPAHLHAHLDEARELFVSAYEAHLCVHTRPYEGVEGALARLAHSGARLALVTNKPERLTLPLLRALGWQDRFEVVICGDTLAERKPHPLPLLTALERLHCAPSEALFVGDTEVDAHAALAARVPLALVPYGRAAPLARSGRFGAHARVSSLPDLAEGATPPAPSVKQQARERFLGLWDLIISVLSIYVIAAISAPLIWRLSAEHLKVLAVFDHVVCGLFLVDFCLRLWSAERKLDYLRWGWLDLISSVPTFDSLRLAKLFRLVRLARLIRALKSARLLHAHLQRRLKDPFLVVAFVSFSVILFGALGVLYFEASAPGANIKTAEEALWWAWVTITTVGYGDRYPVTTEGRLLAGAVMSTGVGLFGIFTVQCTQYFIKSTEAKEQASLELIRDELRGELRDLRAQLSRLERQGEALGEPKPGARGAGREAQDPPPPPPQ